MEPCEPDVLLRTHINQRKTKKSKDLKQAILNHKVDLHNQRINKWW